VLGHTVRLMPPAYVKPYVKRQKSNTTDAEAICEAVTRPFLSKVENTSILRTGVLHRYHYTLNRLPTSRLLLPRSGLERSDFVPWPYCEVRSLLRSVQWGLPDWICSRLSSSHFATELRHRPSGEIKSNAAVETLAPAVSILTVCALNPAKGATIGSHARLHRVTFAHARSLVNARRRCSAVRARRRLRPAN